jgi:hypothetical protein
VETNARNNRRAVVAGINFMIVKNSLKRFVIARKLVW